MPNITTECCKPGVQLHVYQNCTQYCEVSMDLSAWGKCVQRTVPEFNGRIGYGCGTANSNSASSTRSVGWAALLTVGLALGALTL